jgi:hypothetical protein
MTATPERRPRQRRSLDRRLELAGLVFDTAMLESCLRRDPDDTEVLAELAEACTRLRRFRRGLQLDRRLVRRHPKDPIARYNLACSLVLTGDLPGATRELLAAARLGYRDFDHLLRDPDLRRLRRDPSFAELRAQLEQIARQSPRP